MSASMPVGPAREQLHELISILRELRNAGPRDQSFKQWRQVTLTLLQRIWPSEPARAASFRRILFSAPTARADAGATREYYERGCSEATAYLEALAQELEGGLGLKTPAAAAPPAPEAFEPEFPAPPEEPPQTRGVRFQPTRPFEPARMPDPVDEEPYVEPYVEGPPAPEPPARPARPQFDPRNTFADFGTQPPAASSVPAAPPPSPAAPPAPPAPKAAGGKTKARLKDMLGFSDEPAPARPVHAEPPPPVAAMPPPPPPVAAMPPPPPPVIPMPLPPSPVAAVPPPRLVAPPAPPPAMPAVAWPPPSTKQRPAPEPVDEIEDLEDFEETEVEVSEISGIAPEEEPSRPVRRTAPTLAAREVLSMAGLVAELGVPPQRRAIVRAALIDLGRQMDTPPVHWASIRQALAFMLDYPQIARRVLPLLMPYLEEAA